jgi:hypothetical protein
MINLDFVSFVLGVTEELQLGLRELCAGRHGGARSAFIYALRLWRAYNHPARPHGFAAWAHAIQMDMALAGLGKEITG